MILDRLDHAARYHGLHPLFAAAFDVLRRLSAEPPREPGRCPMGPAAPEAYVVIEARDARGRVASPLEAHRCFIDIQLTVAGAEEIGWRPLADCRHPREAFDVERDIGFFTDDPIVWFPVPPGCFAIFFPEDAHAPLGGQGPLRKLIGKVPML